MYRTDEHATNRTDDRTTESADEHTHGRRR
jgi:hypothetical protein